MAEGHASKGMLHNACQCGVVLREGLKIEHRHHRLPYIDLGGIQINPGLQKSTAGDDTLASRAVKR
jgi:hypothetical protein